MGQFGQITHTQTYVVPFHTKKLFTTLRVNSPSFSGRIVPLFDAMLVPQGEGSGTSTKPHHTPSHAAQTPSHTSQTTSSLLHVSTTSIPTVTPTETTPIRHYTRRTRIAQSFVPPTIANEPASLQRNVSQGEACPTDSGFITDQDRATIAKSSTLPHDLAPRVTSPIADEGSMQPNITELTILYTSLQRQHSELLAKFQAQEVEILKLKERVKVLEDREGIAATRFGDDAPIKGRRGIDDVPTSSDSIPTAGPPADDIPTGSDVVPTASPVFAIAIMVTPYSRRKGKEVMSMIDGLDRNNETIAKYLQEYQQFAAELPLERRIELIIIRNNLGWKVKDFKGMTFEEVEVKFNSVYKQMEDFIPMGSKEEAKRYKRKGIRSNQENSKKLKSSEEVIKEAKSAAEIPKEKIKEMMDDLNQLWDLVKKYLSIRPASSNKEMELWVELKRLYELDPEDELVITTLEDPDLSFQQTTKMSVIHCMMMSHGGELLA
nr:hypothetical protein [Tanacetum cinerariifolium]